MSSASATFTLSAATLRNLGHKEYEKRKHAALEVPGQQSPPVSP